MNMFRRLILTTACALSPLACAAPPPASHWITSWMASPQPAWGADFILPTGLPPRLQNSSIRQTVQLSQGGTALRVLLSNRYGATPLEIGEVHVAVAGIGRDTVAGSDRALTFGGSQALHIAAGASALSDPVAFDLPALSRLAITMHVPGSADLSTFHWGAQQSMRIAPGGAASASTPPRAPSFPGRVFLNAVQVQAPAATRAVATLGDSITDGNGSTLDRNRRWPDYLARRFSAHGIAVANAGISGARLLRDGMGVKAAARFDDDVLNQPGVRSVVVALGVNDICWPGTPFAPGEAPPAAADLIAGYRQLIAAARARHVRIVGATIAPFEGALPATPFAGLYATAAKEAIRLQVNRWIRTSGAFDAVADFDAVLRDPAHPARLAARYDSGDHLHPGDAGYAAMARALSEEMLFGVGKAGAPAH